MTVGGMKMLSSLGRTVFAVLRFAVGAGLALIGAGLLRHDPRVPAVLVHLATQQPFGGLWWALVSLAGGVALMLHALPSPWRTDRLADRGAPEAISEPEPAAPTQRSFDGSATPPRRWQPEAWEPDRQLRTQTGRGVTAASADLVGTVGARIGAAGRRAAGPAGRRGRTRAGLPQPAGTPPPLPGPDDRSGSVLTTTSAA